MELDILDDCMQVYWMCFLMGLSRDYNIDDNPIHPILTLPEWFQTRVNPLLNHGLWCLIFRVLDRILTVFHHCFEVTPPMKELYNQVNIKQLLYGNKGL
jgi:hypothetical protein